MLKILKKIFLKKCMVCLLELISRLNFYFSVLIYWLIGGTRYNYSLHWVIIQYHASGLPWWISWWRIHPAMQKTQLRSLGWEDPAEKEMATHSLAWRVLVRRVARTERLSLSLCVTKQYACVVLSLFTSFRGYLLAPAKFSVFLYSLWFR